MQVIVDSLVTHYSVQGEGRNVLLLHGWGDTAQGLSQLQAELSKGYKVVALDLPGFGNTDAPKTDWGLDDYAHFVGQFLAKVDLLPLYGLVGHSNGGAIAVRGAASGMLAPDRLVLLASAGIRSQYRGRKKVLRMVTKAGKLLTWPLPTALKQKLKKQVYATVGSDMLVAEHMQGTFKKVVSDDVQADAAKITAPTLLIYGEDDTATPPSYGQIFHQQIPGSTLEILPGAGHFVHLDRPTEVTTAVKEFLL